MNAEIIAVTSPSIKDREIIVKAFQQAVQYELKGANIEESTMDAAVRVVVEAGMLDPVPQKVELILKKINRMLGTKLKYQVRSDVFKQIAHALKNAGYSKRLFYN